MFGTRILTYNREEIENFIKKYPDTKDVFEKCGNFLKDNYLILSNDNEENSPLYQLELSLRIIIANKRNIEWKITEEILKNLKEITPNKKVLWELEDEIFDLFEDDVPLICKDFLYVEFLSKNPKKYVIEVSSMSTLENDIFKFKNNEDNLENIWNNALYNFLNENYDEID